MDSVYLDHNATTSVDPRVVEAMLPLWTEHWGNAGSGHAFGRPVGKAVHAARRSVADTLGVDPLEVVFTGSGTEADNLALRGVVLAHDPPVHVVTTAVEHPAVLETVRDLEAQGRCELSVVGVDGAGRLDLDAFRAALRTDTALVSVMWANNETGVVFPIPEVVEAAHAVGARVHVDAVQAVGKLPLRLDEVPVDLLAISAHKFHGPKGVGALVVRRGLTLHPNLTGGGQERGRRSGTENPAGMVGLAKALELAAADQAAGAARLAGLRDHLEAELVSRIPGILVSGHGAERVANTLHLTIEGVEAEPVLAHLDRAGIACSAGSACSTGALEPSHVLAAMGVPASHIHGALRFSLGRHTTEAEVDRVVEVLPGVVENLRKLVG